MRLCKHFPMVSVTSFCLILYSPTLEEIYIRHTVLYFPKSSHQSVTMSNEHTSPSRSKSFLITRLRGYFIYQETMRTLLRNLSQKPLEKEPAITDRGMAWVLTLQYDPS
uniref:Uncharacterized protein n=1 Tax=Anguilla anguilla TaxID=7936 RepID=A0A0E9SXN5_ANGAN